MKGVADLKALLKQRTWDKEVLLWHGSEKPLIQALGSTKHVVLDLLEAPSSGWVKVRHRDGATGFVAINQVWGL